MTTYATNKPFIQQPGPAPDCFAITPSDVTALPAPVRAIYVGGTGNVTIITPLGASVTFRNCPAGLILPFEAAQVMATGTTATFLVGAR